VKTVALSLALMVLAASCSGSRASAPPLQHRYSDPLGWSLAYPSGMHLERSKVSARLYISEVTLASFTPRRGVESGGNTRGGWIRVNPPRPARGHFPAGGVAFRLVYQNGGPGPDIESRESRFPLRLTSFRPATDYGPARPRPVELPIAADGRTYRAFAWIGLEAPDRLRAELAQIIESVRIPKLHTGSVVGYGFTVLRRAGSYPVGSFTRVRAQGQPFVLVHAPGGFYAIGWRWETISGGYKARCNLVLSEFEFSCTNSRARWDRVGRVLVRPAWEVAKDPLNIAVAKVAWDGHVLLFPGSAAFGDARLARKLWPG
jgi:hypothetical protein